MTNHENNERVDSDNSGTEEENKKRFKRQPRKTQGQMIQEALGLNEIDIKDIEKKLRIVRFLDYFSEETLQFIFNDNVLNQYIKETTSHLSSLSREEDKLLKQTFESREILDIINKLKMEAEKLAISKGVKNSVEKRLRKISLMLMLPMFIPVVIAFIWPGLTYFVLPLLCVFCLAPQLIRNSVVKKWFAFKEENKNQIYSQYREDIMILKNFAGELLENIRARLIELHVPLQLIKFVLHSQDYQNLTLVSQRNIRGSMQYVYTFEYPSGTVPFSVPPQLQQYEEPIIPERRVSETVEKNFILLTSVKGHNGIIDYFEPVLRDKFADEINEMLNNSEFDKAPNDFSIIMPNYSENMAIYCVCGEIAEFKNIHICNWKNQFKFYLFEGKKCVCGDQVYALSLMDESADIPDELKDIFRA
jgi:hypothetical protein